MSSYINDLVKALRVRVGAAWPEVQADGIYTAEHISQIPWEKLTVPYAVIAIDSAPRGPQWGISNQVHQMAVEIYYVCRVRGPLSGIVDKLTDLEGDLLHNALTSGQVLTVEGFTWSDSLTPNQVLAIKNNSCRAGRLTANCIAGVIP